MEVKRLAKGIKKDDQIIRCLQEIYFKFSDIGRLKIKA